MSKEKEIRITGGDDSGNGERDAASTSTENTEPHNNIDKTLSKQAPDTGEQEPETELPESDRLKARIEELEDKLLRAMADFDNHKKRSARQREEAIRWANDLILGQLLEVMDNFERALQHADENSNEDAVRQGTEMIYNQMKDLFDKYQVRPIEAIGQPFDPRYHEALMQIASDVYDEGIVATEVARGYMIEDRVLRYSKVGVSKGPADEDTGEESDPK